VEGSLFRRAEPPPAPDEPAPPSAEEPPPRTEPLSSRIGRVDPQAGELSELLRERLALPGVVAAGIAGATAAGIVLAAGLLIALLTPDFSIVGAVGVRVGFITEAFRQAVGTLLTPMYDSGGLIAASRRIHPLALLLIPLAAVALATRWQLHRTEGAKPLARLGWAMLVAVPFAVFMLIFALLSGESEEIGIAPPPGSAFALGLVWGALGALIGAATKLRVAVTLPAAVPRAAVLAALRPLAAVLAVCTVLGLAGWLVQVTRDVDRVRADRSAVTALVEEAAFAGEHGIHLTALASAARFRADASGALGLPFPVEEPNDVPERDGTFRIFAYDDELPAVVLLPATILLMLLLALAALYAGFAAARAAGARTLLAGAGWGALTGPAWAIAMALLVVLAGGLFHGDPDDASVFGIFLFGGALFGAAGGALAVSGEPAEPAGV
jgi:hypothetical protein